MPYTYQEKTFYRINDIQGKIYSPYKHSSDLSFELHQSNFNIILVLNEKRFFFDFQFSLLYFFSIIAFPLAMCIGLNHIRYFVLLYFCKIERKLFPSHLLYQVNRSKEKELIYPLR